MRLSIVCNPSFLIGLFPAFKTDTAGTKKNILCCAGKDLRSSTRVLLGFRKNCWGTQLKIPDASR